MNFKEHRILIEIAIPVIIGQVSSFLMSFTDNLIVGRLGTNAFSAASLANSSFWLIAVLAFGGLNAVPSVIAEARGAQDDDAIRQNLHASLKLGIWYGIIVGVLLFLFALALPYMGQPVSDVEQAKPFTIILALSIPFLCLFSSIKGFFDGMEHTAVGMKLSILGLVLNLFFNIGLVFGKFGFPELGLLGSAWATLISRILIFIAMWIFFKKSDLSKPYLNTPPIEPKYFTNLLKMSIPMAFQLFFEVAAFCGAGIMVGWFPGEQAIIGRDAHQIALNMASGTFMFFIGLSVAGSVRVGEAFGRGNQADVLKAGKATLSLGITFAVIGASLLIFFREQITALYGIHDVAVQTVTIRLVVIAAIFQLFDGTQCIGAGLLRGVQDVKVPTLITFIAYWIIWIPLAYYLGFMLNMGIDGIWYADVIALAFAAICLNWRFFRLGRQSVVSSSDVL